MTNLRRGRPIKALDDRADVSIDALLGARLAAGLTRAQVRAAVGCAERTLADWERGHSRPPRTAVRELARLYRVPVRSLLASESAKI